MTNPLIFTNIINGYLPEPHASLLNGIIFGTPINSSKVFYQQLKTVGLLHLVVLSGMNITILGTIVTSILFNIGKRLQIMITILIIVLFVLFVGPQAPIVRAAIMGIITLVGIIIKRKTYVWYSLFLSIIIIGIFKPTWLTTLSLQLSYGATIGLILFSRINNVKIPKSANNIQVLLVKIKHAVWSELKPSLAAQVFTAPLIFINFKQLSLISPIANLLVAPLIMPLMILGFVTAILGKIFTPIGLIPAYLCYGLLSYMVWIIDCLSKLPFVFFQF